MQENYNIYSSTYHSNAQKTFYLALNKLGQPRKTHLPAGKDLGKLATYAKSLTFTIPEKRSEALIARIFGMNHVKHGLKQLCDSGKTLAEIELKNTIQAGNCGKRQRNKAITSPNTKCNEENCARKSKNSYKNSAVRGQAFSPKHKDKNLINSRKQKKTEN